MLSFPCLRGTSHVYVVVVVVLVASLGSLPSVADKKDASTICTHQGFPRDKLPAL